MGMRALESAVLAELRNVEKDRSIKLKEVAWALGNKLPEGYAREGDKIVHLTLHHLGNQSVVVAYKPKVKKA